MNSIYLCFRLVKRDYFFEVILDQKLSFGENMKMMNNILENHIDLADLIIFDPNKRISLDITAPISEFNFRNGQFLLIF